MSFEVFENKTCKKEAHLDLMVLINLIIYSDCFDNDNFSSLYKKKRYSIELCKYGTMNEGRTAWV